MARKPKIATKAGQRTKRRPEAIHLDTVRLEGGIISSAMLAAIVARDATDQTDADYRVHKGLDLKDEVARFFKIGRAHHAAFSEAKSPTPESTAAYVATLLREVFEFPDVAHAPARRANERNFAIALEVGGGKVPIAVATPAESVDVPTPRLALDGRRTSAASTVQDWLDATDGATWGIATDGRVMRILRDNASFTRPAYIDIDLAQIFEGEALGEFTAAWLLLHASRFGDAGAAVDDCPLERWRNASAKQGEVARERLRAGVEDALQSLGTGFLEHPANAALRDHVGDTSTALKVLFGECLQVVYRMIFLFAAEDRDLLHPPAADPAARALYADGYSMGSLRTRAARRTSYDAHHDMWEGVNIVFELLAGPGDEASARAAVLGLPILDGLFAENRLTILQDARLSNRRLMQAVRRLAWLDGPGGTVPVNWRDMETEELGSVYESLLELTPVLSDDGRGMSFAIGDETKGNQRKITGSYYTPESLVKALLDTTLDPVLDRAERENADPVEGLLELKVIDPACGSGHFLLAAARRIAMRVSRLRGGGVADRLAFRHAMRDVVRRCVHGVDRNPMAVDLTKVALWIETVDPGKPLGFLDANLRCGDALLGVFDRESLVRGIPDDAYKPLTGDDKGAARDLGRRNASEKAAQGTLGLNGGASALPPAWPIVAAAAELRSMPEETVEDVIARRRAFGRETAPGRALIGMACDLYVAAFLAPKMAPKAGGHWPDRSPTTSDVVLVYDGHAVDPDLLDRWTSLANEARSFHWFLAFPDIMESGGFDVVIGNPPWEVMQLSEEEYFARRLPELAKLAGSERKSGIAALKLANPSVFKAFQSDKRASEAAGEFSRASGRFRLTARGKLNTYALFAELFTTLTSGRGRAGIIVPTGIATDASTAPFFASLVTGKRVVRLTDFENREAIFPAVHRSFKFCLLTTGHDQSEAKFSFYLGNTGQIADADRQFTLTAEQVGRVNPNTRTAPIFRSQVDAEIAAKIYKHVPVLIDEERGRESNPWHLEFSQGLFNMTSDSGQFYTSKALEAVHFVRDGTDYVSADTVHSKDASLQLRGTRTMPDRLVPLYEAKMIHQFDHRWAIYEGKESRDATIKEHEDNTFESTPMYWVDQQDVEARLNAKRWKRGWVLGWRDIARATDERTSIFCIMPRVAVGHTSPLMLTPLAPIQIAALYANMNAIVLDYVARQKVGGTHLTYGYLNQFPILGPSAYSDADLAFIRSRVLELTFTSLSVRPFARDLEYDGLPFEWNENRRAVLRAELDARFARLYGLTRDELRYVLDPAEVRGENYPSETFRVLKDNEHRRYKEYRTARLVLAAWDAEDGASPRLAAE